jgi:hypothetical protein
MAGCCGSDGRSRVGRLIWTRVWFAIAALVLGLWAWERQPHHRAAVGPHGGPLADWGGGAFRLEVVPDREAGTVTVYALDRWAKRPKPVDAGSLTLTLATDPETVVRLDPAPADAAGRSSRFTARHEAFRGTGPLAGTVAGTAGGKAYSGPFGQKPAAGVPGPPHEESP